MRCDCVTHCQQTLWRQSYLGKKENTKLGTHGTIRESLIQSCSIPYQPKADFAPESPIRLRSHGAVQPQHRSVRWCMASPAIRRGSSPYLGFQASAPDAQVLSEAKASPFGRIIGVSLVLGTPERIRLLVHAEENGHSSIEAGSAQPFGRKNDARRLRRYRHVLC